MLRRKDLRVVQALRRGSRRKLAELAAETELPLSTFHDRLCRLAREGTIRPVALPDFCALRMPVQVMLVIDASDKEEAIRILQDSPHVNTLLSVHNGADLVAECVFGTFAEQYALLEQLESVGKVSAHPVVREVARENAKVSVASPEPS